MTDRMDIVVTRKYTANGEERTAYTKIGVAFPLQNGGWRMNFEALPTAQIFDGKVSTSALLLPPREPSERSNTRPERPQAGGAPAVPDDDPIPFLAW